MVARNRASIGVLIEATGRSGPSCPTRRSRVSAYTRWLDGARSRSVRNPVPPGPKCWVSRFAVNTGESFCRHGGDRLCQLSDLGLNHQVLAYAYTETAGSVTVRVYDPNRGQNDDVTIRFDTGQPTGATTFTHNLDIDHDVRGFFRSTYTPQPPPTG